MRWSFIRKKSVNWPEALEQQKERNEQLQQHVNDVAPVHVDASAEVRALNERVVQLQDALERAESRSVDQYIQRLDALEAVLVCFHPGAGHLTIQPEHMQAYSDNPAAYAAEKCGVTESCYVRWLDHYDSPGCNRCGAEVPRIEQPSAFCDGVHTLCPEHQSADV